MLQPIAIYIRRNTINGKGYVGQSVDPLHRWHHESYEKAVIGHALRKYGVECFDSQILFWVQTRDAANFWECYLIELYDTLRPKGYNIRDGGSHGNPFAGKSVAEMEVIIAKMSAARKGENNPNWGKHHSPKTRAKISAAQTGRKHSPETCAKNSVARQGEKNPFYGKSHSPEALQKMSDAHKGKNTGKSNVFYGKKHSDETRKKMSEKGRGRVPWNKGKSPSVESRRRMSDAKKGRPSEKKGKRRHKKSSVLQIKFL